MTDAEVHAAQTALLEEFRGSTAEAARVFLGVALGALQLTHGENGLPGYLRSLADQIEARQVRSASPRPGLRLVSDRGA